MYFYLKLYVNYNGSITNHTIANKHYRPHRSLCTVMLFLRFFLRLNVHPKVEKSFHVDILTMQSQLTTSCLGWQISRAKNLCLGMTLAMQQQHQCMPHLHTCLLLILRGPSCTLNPFLHQSASSHPTCRQKWPASAKQKNWIQTRQVFYFTHLSIWSSIYLKLRQNINNQLMTWMLSQ